MIATCRFHQRIMLLAFGVLIASPMRHAAAQAQPAPAQPAAAQPAPSQPSEEVDAQYKSTIENAVAEFGLKNWAEARALFRRAHQLSPSARTLRGMGMAAFELKMYVDAQRDLAAALADTQRPLTEEQRAQVASLFEQTKSYVGKYRVTVDPATAKLQVDDQEATLDDGNVLLLGLGAHTISARAAGMEDAQLTLKVEGGEDLPLEIKLSAPQAAAQPTAAPVIAPASPAPAAQADEGMSTATTVGWVLLAGAAAFGGSAAAFWFIGQGQYDDLDTSCGSTLAGCSNKQIADSGVETSDLLHGVSVAVAGAALVGSVVCFVVGAGDSGEAESAALHVGPTSVTLRGKF